jgi:hypothetical protein
MRIWSFIIAYALVLAILLFADRRPGPTQQGRYSHVVDLTDGQNPTAPHAMAPGFRTRIIAPAALIPGTWAAGEILHGGWTLRQVAHHVADKSHELLFRKNIDVRCICGSALLLLTTAVPPA